MEHWFIKKIWNKWQQPEYLKKSNASCIHYFIVNILPKNIRIMNTNKNIVTQLHDLKYDSTKLHT